MNVRKLFFGLMVPLLVLPVSLAAQERQFENPLRFETVEEFLGSILSSIRTIIVTLALVAIVIGALLYIFSGGNENRITAAKKAITAAVFGLSIAVAAPSFLLEVYTAVQGTVPPDTVPEGTLTLTQIAVNVLKFLLGVVGTLAIIMLVVGGAMYVTAAGDERQIDTAKNVVKYSIIGIAVALAAMIIVRTVTAILMGDINIR